MTTREVFEKILRFRFYNFWQYYVLSLKNKGADFNTHRQAEKGVKTMRQGLVAATDSAFSGRVDAAAPAVGGAEDHLIIEDGWVFREHHGKYVECICRSDELSRRGSTYKGVSRR